MSGKKIKTCKFVKAGVFFWEKKEVEDFLLLKNSMRYGNIKHTRK
jgi:hypothetical protein